MPEVLVIGAGLAGLACALHLRDGGVDVALHEASDAVGGRVRTDVVDGMLLDRGFQVHNTGYPEAMRMLDHEALDLQAFTPGALLRYGASLHRLADPRRKPAWALSTALAPIGSLKDKAAVAAVAARAALTPVPRLLDAPETTTYEALRARGLSDTVIDRFLRPFLSGVFLETDLSTSSHFFDLVWRSFVRGTQCVPAGGMQAMPEQLAARLPEGVLHLGSPMTSLPSGTPVVVATGGRAAADLLGTAVPAFRGVTTHYHVADAPVMTGKAIVLDGEGGGPVANSVVLSNVAPTYAPGRVLVSSSVVTGDASEAAVRSHLARLYGVDTARWEQVRAYEIPDALPSMAPPIGRLRKPVLVREGVFVCGDHRDTASIQGALVSGRRAAIAVLRSLGR